MLYKLMNKCENDVYLEYIYICPCHLMLQVEVGGRTLGRGSGATWDDAKQQVSLLVQHISNFGTSLSVK
jgi:hypothetical protein